MLPSHSDISLEIDLEAIKYNYLSLSRMAGKAKAAAVVKANAYGLGIDKVAPVLYSAGCRDFFVATIDEALELTKILAPDAHIHVFHGVKRGEENLFSSNNIIPVINNRYQLDIWLSTARDEALKLPCILHFDTGINRLGFNESEAKELSESQEVKKLDIKYIMSHLACSGDESHPMNKQQLESVKKISALFPNTPVSLANSMGVLSGPEYHFDLIRPGCSLYGVKSGKNADIKNVITVKAKIINIRQVEEDSFVGYGATVKVKKGTRLAVVPLGYADGYLRSLSNNSYGFFDSKKLPLLGRVSMDMSILDISNVDVKLGDEVEMIGENYTVDEVAANAGTIGYEILTNLGSRYKRSYKLKS